MTRQTVTRLYDTYEDAASTVHELEGAGIPADDISLVASKVGAVHGQSHPSQSHPKTDAGVHAAEAGAGLGGVIGGGAGLLAGLGMLAIPGVGPVVAAGWLVATLAGLGAGAAAGGLLGGLAGAGLTTEHAEILAEGIRRGGTLVTARVSEERAQEVERIMDRNRSVDIDARRAAYASGGWSKFDESAPPYSGDEIRAVPSDRPGLL